MRKIIVLMICLTNVLCVSSVFAEDGIVNPKIGILDIQQLITRTNFANKAIVKLRNQYAAQSKALKNEQRLLAHDIVKYNKNSSKMKPEELKKWQHKIDTRQKKIQEDQMDLEKKMMVAQNIETEDVIERFSVIVSKIAQKDNIDFVLFKDVTLYSTDAQNITNEVIRLSAKKSK